MLIQPAKASASLAGLRVGGAVAGTRRRRLVVAAPIRPEMGMAMLHAVLSAAGV